MSDIDVTVKKDSTSILTGYQAEDGTESDAVTFQSESDPDALGIAVDLGTTTVAMELVQLATGVTISQHGFLNPQIKYGSDVISRIKKGSTRDGLEELEKAIKSGLTDGISSMTDHPEHISKMVISGNTTMNSILEDMTLVRPRLFEQAGVFEPVEPNPGEIARVRFCQLFGGYRKTVCMIMGLRQLVGDGDIRNREGAPHARGRRGLRALENAVFRAVGRLYTAAAARRDAGRCFRQRDGAALHVPR